MQQPGQGTASLAARNTTHTARRMAETGHKMGGRIWHLALGQHRILRPSLGRSAKYNRNTKITEHDDLI